MMSGQERWLLAHAPDGLWDVKQLRELLPPTDPRRRAVQSASLCRAVSRLVRRGFIERCVREQASARGVYLFRTVRPR